MYIFFMSWPLISVPGTNNYFIKFWAKHTCHAIWSIPHSSHVLLSYHEFHETCHSVTIYFMKKDCKRCRDTTTPESIHTKDESKRGSAFAFIFGVN